MHSQSGRLQSAVRTAWALVAVAATIYLLLDALPGVDHALHEGPVDGSIDWIGARAFWEHVNPFSPEGLLRYNIAKYGFGHPPTTPFWFLPLTRWGVEVMGYVVGYITLFLLLIHLSLLCDDLAVPAAPATAMLIFAAVLSTSWFRDHLHMAQLSEAIAFLLVLSWYFLRRNRDVLGGAMLGLSITLKLFPGLIVVFLLLARRWRAVAAACASWFAVALVMTWRYGLACWPQFFKLQGPVANRWIGDIRNGSLHGIVLRAFHPACTGIRGTLPRATILTVVVALALVAAGSWLSRRAMERRQIELPFALFALISTFVNPWNWEHYNVLLLLPFLVVATALWRSRRHGLPLWAVGVGAVVLAAVVWMVGVDLYLKGNLAHEYMVSLNHRVHVRMHFYEVVNWLPQVLLMLMIGALLAWNDSKRGASASLIPPPAIAAA